MNAEHTAAAPEPFALARRGLPLVTRNATPPRAVWLPPQLCSRAQPVVQRATPVAVAPEVSDETQAWLQDVPQSPVPTPEGRNEEPWWMEAAAWVPVQEPAPAALATPAPAPAPREVATVATTVAPASTSIPHAPLDEPRSRIETVVREQLAPQTLSSALSQSAAAPAAVRPASTAPMVSNPSTSRPPATPAPAAPQTVTQEQRTQVMHTTEHSVGQTVVQPMAQPAQGRAEVPLTPLKTRAATFIEVVRTEHEPKASTPSAATERMGAVSTPAPTPTRNADALSSPLSVVSQPAANIPAHATERERAATALADIRAAAAAPVPRSVHIERIAVTVSTPEPTRAQPSPAPVLPAAAMPSSAAAGARSYRSAWSSYFVRRD